MTDRSGSMGAVLAMLACAAWPGRASAGQARVDAAEPIGVLEVATPGMSETAGDKFEQSVEETLQGVDFHVMRSKQLQEKLAGSNFVAGCTFGPCLKEVLRRTGLRRVLVARIQGAGQTYSMVVSLVDTRDGRLVAQVAQSCPVCTVDEAISTATLAVVELLKGPAGGEAIDRADAAARQLAASRTQVLVRAAARLERRGRQVRRAGWIFVLTGAAAAGLGGALVALDRADLGAASLGAGGGLVAAGVGALVWSRDF